jgi:outer membrane receptor protein involved in Fe transport
MTGTHQQPHHGERQVMKNPSKRTTRTAIAIAAAILASSAWAQQAAEGDSAGSQAAEKKPAREAGIQSILVTAQKRKEDVNKVPISVSVMKGEDLAAEHIGGLEDITRAIPNISFSGGSQGNGAGLSNIEMRGIASSAGSGTVGIYMDDVSMTTRNLYSLGSPEPKFFDVDRIEVLRGPQGTLYGASSMGGTIKFILNQPDLKRYDNAVHAEVSKTSGGGWNTTADAVLNVPLIPNELALRIGVQAGHISGYMNQLNPDTLAVVKSRTNDEDDRVLRLAMKWQPTKDLSITPALFYQEIKTGDLATEYPVSHTTGAALPPFSTTKPVLEPGNDKLLTPSLTVNYDMGFADLISVTSYYKREFDRTQDGTQANSSYIGCCLMGPNAPAGLVNEITVFPSYVLLDNQVRQFSQEVRLASKPYDSKSANPWTWLGGLYFSNLHTTVNDNEPMPGINALFAKYGVSPDDPDVVSGSFPGAFANESAYYSARHYRTVQHAAFGEVSYHFTPTIAATAGIRSVYAIDSLEREGSNYFTGNPGITKQNPNPVNTHAYTPKFSLTWNVDDSNMVYATAAKGFRLGGQNRDIPVSVCGDELKGLGFADGHAPGAFGPDSLWSYEIGNKSRFLNNRLAINTAFYYINWDNIQVDKSLNCTFDFETNAGHAKSMGLEIEVRGKPTPDLTLGLTAGYANAYLTEDVDALGSKAGQFVPGVPRFSASLSGEYHFEITNNVDGFARLSSNWTGASFGTPNEGAPDYRRPGYKIVNASLGANLGKWQVSLFAKNLLNEDKVIQRPVVQFFQENYRISPRTVGVSLSGKI